MSDPENYDDDFYEEDDFEEEEYSQDSCAYSLDESTEEIIQDAVNDENDVDNKETKTIPIDREEVENDENAVEDRETKIIPTDLDEEELHQRLYESSKRLVNEGEKNVSLAHSLDEARDLLRKREADMKEMRLILLEGINGGTSNINDFENISLPQLMRIRLQEYQDFGDPNLLNMSFFSKKSSCQKNDFDTSFYSKKSLDGDASIVSNARECQCDRLRQEIHKMSQRSRRDREQKYKLQSQIEEEKGKIEALSSHIEKLMIHLKHEAITKAKALNERSRFRKEIESLKEQNRLLTKKNARKDQAIQDLKDGSKVLEDQLTLMDDKYMDLRMKLDWGRNQTEKVLREKTEEIKDLRLQILAAEKDHSALLKKLENKGERKVSNSNKYSLKRVGKLPMKNKHTIVPKNAAVT
ncbi:hypothetical protein CTEN210_14258 [Chaetoceros tenuissimus]|uniref:Uncharacterized protein n=1 Tax=Chaetoceros tenuissimus TaxID=426638 RepID=A0AAD3HBK8_9STRA|nr:hypothetical protein CTEN210_14258 [Chaetoceros tenuissimus]